MVPHANLERSCKTKLHRMLESRRLFYSEPDEPSLNQLIIS